jgi:carboxylesterase type B
MLTLARPMVLEPLNAIKMEFGFIQNSLPIPELKTSGTECLHLNITVPLLEGVPPGKETKLPVFVFVHGGGYSIGSNSWPQYDQSRIVKLSNELGMPVLGVGIK